MKKRLTTEEFISKAREVHGDKYDYSRMTYVNSRTKVCIICPVHGEFLISPNNHLRGKGCARCAGNKKMSNQEIIEKALLVHGDKYDYSMAFCEENKGEMTIICPKHGIFKQSIKRHIGGQGCPICGREKMGHYHKSNVEEFSLRGKEIHGDRYDYSKVEYKNCDTKVCIICPEHGEFWQTPYAHIHRKQGCPMCGSTKISERLRMKREDFELRARAVHGEKYDYSNVEYKGRDEPICIVCSTHGEFWQKPSVHLMGCGCRKCANENIGKKNKLTQEDFIAKARLIHGDKYDYGLVNYQGFYTPVKIICPSHGVFEQKPANHLSKKGCRKCSIEYRRQLRMLDTDEFIRRSKAIHGDKYDYSKSIYTYALNKIEVVCPTHGSFWQDAEAHMCGRGCPKCSESLGEKKIAFILNKYGIKHERQYRIITDLKLFGKHDFFIVDFYLPKENLIIEFNGKQHYVTVPHFHRETSDFLKQKRRDQKLRDWCKDNNINLLEIKYDQIDNIKKILKQHIKF